MHQNLYLLQNRYHPYLNLTALDILLKDFLQKNRKQGAVIVSIKLLPYGSGGGDKKEKKLFPYNDDDNSLICHY